MKRSSHIAIRVPADKVEEAAGFYQAMLGAHERSRDGAGVELAGPNFMLYVEPDEKPVVLQEFVAGVNAATPDGFKAAGCTVFDESEFGFHVSDPYGMSYHIWLNQDSAPSEAP